MKLNTILAALCFSMAASSASATVLEFSKLTEMMYGDGFPLADSMRYDGPNLKYEESGFQLTLHAPNAAPGAANVGSGTFEPQTYNWHDGLDNGSDTFVTLTRIGGGLFNLSGFDYFADWSSISADGKLVGVIQDAGIWATALTGIMELRISSGAFTQIDNIDVEASTRAVGLPGTLSLMLAGFAAAGFTRRRR
ncbi:hypothetical protein ACN9MU_18465 [Pseudoduganella sp. R-32]|uniref:hypothetical protein n=1 Tax=Pseudoduganella sp. R-32 TaxID=3404061 RepID=UPI003CFAA6F5